MFKLFKKKENIILNEDNTVQEIKDKYYADFDEKPYISEERDFNDWEYRVKMFPKMLVQKEMMIKNDDDFLPGEILLLWHLTKNKNTSSDIPGYFEFKYGINYKEVIQDYIDNSYMELTSDEDSLKYLTIQQLKDILKQSNKKVTGNKNHLIERIITHISKIEYKDFINVRGYCLTNKGEKLIAKNNHIIENHLNLNSPKTMTYQEKIDYAKKTLKEEIKNIDNDSTGKYKIIVHYTPRTCKKCLEMENKYFNYESAQIGINYPPFHEDCDCFASEILPKWLEEITNKENTSTKSAKDKNYKSITIPKNMSYKEYKNKYLK